jgi:hypothetical protein
VHVHRAAHAGERDTECCCVLKVDGRGYSRPVIPVRVGTWPLLGDAVRLSGFVPCSSSLFKYHSLQSRYTVRVHRMAPDPEPPFLEHYNPHFQYIVPSSTCLMIRRPMIYDMILTCHISLSDKMKTVGIPHTHSPIPRTHTMSTHVNLLLLL